MFTNTLGDSAGGGLYMTNKYERLNKLVNQDMLDDILSDIDEADIVPSNKVDLSLGPNTHLKKFIKEHDNITTSSFGQLIGINKASTSRCKVNRQSKMTPEELRRTADVTGIDIEVLKLENLVPKDQKIDESIMIIGEPTETSKSIIMKNESGKHIMQIKIRTVSNHKSVKLLMMDDEQIFCNGTSVNFVFEPSWGQNYEFELTYHDGSVSYIDGILINQIEWLEVRPGSDFATDIAEHTEFYMLLQYDPDECEYFTVSYLTYNQADKFLHKYGQVRNELKNFLLGSTGELCDGKYCLIEAC
jgi:hypothetical protein